MGLVGWWLKFPRRARLRIGLLGVAVRYNARVGACGASILIAACSATALYLDTLVTKPALERVVAEPPGGRVDRQ